MLIYLDRTYTIQFLILAGLLPKYILKLKHKIVLIMQKQKKIFIHVILVICAVQCRADILIGLEAQ